MEQLYLKLYNCGNYAIWKHPVTKQTNLPGGYDTPEEAGY